MDKKRSYLCFLHKYPVFILSILTPFFVPIRNHRTDFPAYVFLVQLLSLHQKHRRFGQTPETGERNPTGNRFSALPDRAAGPPARQEAE
ncbi:hypothetical protein, partial [Dysosmobacter sp.]|uniref:hypothetical protein n=1 Tax=Dysosmobacter sp. TaxID=2591382 RepID=UPI003D92DFF0